MPETIPQVMDELGHRARAAAQHLAMSGGDVRDAALNAAAVELRSRSNEIIAVLGASLFSGNTRNEVTLVHQTSGLYNGDVNGEVRYTLFTR